MKIRSNIIFFLLIVVSLKGMYKESSADIPCIDTSSDESSKTIMQKVREIKRMGLAVKDALQCQLNKSMNNIFEKIKKELKITDRELQTYQERLKQFKMHSKLMSSSYTNIWKAGCGFEDKIKSLIRECGVNPTVIAIENSDWDTFGSAEQKLKGKMTTFGSINPHENIIYLNRYNLENYFSNQETLSFIAHEIMHLTEYDCIKFKLLAHLLEDRGINWHSSVRLLGSLTSFRDYRKVSELKADVMAACLGIGFAEGLKQGLKTMKRIEHELVSSFDYDFHPSDEKRIRAIDKVIAYLKAEESLKGS